MFESASLHMPRVARFVGRSLGDVASCYRDQIKQDDNESEECAPTVARPSSGRWLMAWSTPEVKRGVHTCSCNRVELRRTIAKVL